MEKFFDKTKKVLRIVIIVVMINLCALPVLAATSYPTKDGIDKGTTLKFTGGSWCVYPSEAKANKGGVANASAFLVVNTKIEVKEVKDNILKIAYNKKTGYIYYGSTGNKYFKKVSTGNVAVKKVELNASKLTIGIGESKTIKATVSPSNAIDQNVTFSSSNTKIAKVSSSGKITGVAKGTATITVKTSNKKTATCKVTIVKPVAVTTIKLNKTKMDLEIGKTETLTVTIAPDNATDKNVTWESSNKNVVTVLGGKIKAVGIGSAEITATAKNGKKVSCKVTVKDTYTYEFKDNTYKIAVTKTKLDNVLKTISNKKIYQSVGGNARGKCNRIATYHIYMLLGRVDLEKASLSAAISSSYDIAGNGNSTGTNFSNVKKAIDNHQPVRLHVNSGEGEHWVTVVGYKGNGTSLSDYLVLSSWHGYLIKGGTGDALKLYGSTSGMVRTYN